MKKLAITLMIILGVGISFDTSAQFNQFKELKNLADQRLIAQNLVNQNLFLFKSYF